MPRLPKDFSKGLIYKLCCKDPTIKEIYVGSTTNFTQRKRNHKSDCNNSNPNNKKYNHKVYRFIRENGGWTNFNMILIEYFPCQTELELCRREDYWKNELQAILNSNTPHIYETQKEYREVNKEQILEKNKDYRQAHREKILEKQKEWYEANRDKLKEKAKEYHHAHREEILEKQKEYREAKREEILVIKNEKIICVCGCIVGRSNMKRHEKTAKHISFISAKQNQRDLNIPNNFCEIV